MAHFAKIEDGIVSNVIVVNNATLQNKDFPQSEIIGQKFIKSLGLDGKWIQTSYNGNFRKRYAGQGYTYNEDLDVFLKEKPYESWVLDEETAEWVAPIPNPYPDGGVWNEINQEWTE